MQARVIALGCLAAAAAACGGGGNDDGVVGPSAPDAVMASDGTSTTQVAVTWSAVDGASGYQVYRDGAMIAEIAGASFDDVGAEPGGAPAAPGALTASAGTDVDGVDVTWNATVAPDGTAHVYRVRAVSDAGVSADSDGDTGYRAASPVTGYELSIDGGAFVALGAITSYRDVDAAAGTITAGQAAASAGTSTAHVALSLSGASTSPGASRMYVVRAVNERGAGSASAPVEGHRGVGALSYQWQRSSADADATYSDLTGATSVTYDDVTAPSSGEGRYYRCVAAATGATAATTAPARGYRALAPPTSPTDVIASDGTSSSHVTVTWMPVAGATSYRVYRDGAVVTTVTATTADDTGAGAPPAPTAPASLAATSGTYTDRVALSWSAATANAGASHSYTVIAANSAGDSAPSTADTGYRGAAPVLGYELAIDGGSFVSSGVLTTHDDTSAPAGIITAGTAQASDGAFTTHVALSLSGAIAAPGASRNYQVRAVSAAGAGAASNTATGNRGVGTLTFQWQRSSGDADATYTDLAGATAATFDDTMAPANGAGRFYRCVVSASDAMPATSTSDRGRRMPEPGDIARADAWVSDKPILAMTAGVGVMYVGGNFDYLGPPTGGFTSLDPTTGQPDLTQPFVRGDVWAAAPDGAGGWYLGGSLYSIDGVRVGHLVHMLADGTVDPSFVADPSSYVREIVLSGGTLYVAGDFRTIGGQTREFLAALDPATGAATAWNPQPNLPVTDMIVSGSVVYVAGSFTSVGTTARNHLAAISTSSGAATAWNPNANSDVYAIAVSGNIIYVGGAFSTIGGATRQFIAAVNDTTGAATAWNPSADYRVFDVVVSGGTVYASGSFTSIGGATRRGVAALSASTGVATAFNAQLDAEASVLGLDGGVLYVGSEYFRSAAGQSRVRVAAFNTSTGALTSWSPGASYGPSGFVFSAGRVYLMGGFASAGGAQRRGLAAIDVATGAATTWNPIVTGQVNALARSGNVLYVGGSFSAVGGQARSGLAAVDVATAAVTAWNPAPSESWLNVRIENLALSGDVVYAAGNFSTIGGQARSHIAAIDRVDGTVLPWNPSLNGAVRALAVSGGIVYVGGNLTTIGGEARWRLGAIDAATGAPTAWNPTPDTYVEAIAADGATIYVGGQFTTMGGQSRSRIAAVDAVTGTVRSWNPGANAQVEDIVVRGGAVYLAGAFSTVGGQPHSKVAAVDAATGVVRPWSPALSYSSAVSLGFVDDTLYVGGYFLIMDAIYRTYLALFDP
jgi:trimeric autotransporter adhesin